MDFLKSNTDDSQTNTTTTNSSGDDLFSSAKVVAGAAQSQLHSQDYDKPKAAGAGADLLGAASDYTKLDDTQGVGKYVAQGEEYLRNYSNPTDAKDHPVDTKIPDDDSVPNKTLAGEADDSGDLKSGITDKIAGAGAGADSDVLKSSSGDNETGVLKSSGIGGGEYSEEVKTAVGEKIGSGEGVVEEYEKKADEGEGFLSKTVGEETEKKVEELGSDDEVVEKKSELETQAGGGFGSSVKKIAGSFLSKWSMIEAIHLNNRFIDVNVVDLVWCINTSTITIHMQIRIGYENEYEYEYRYYICVVCKILM